MAAKAYHWTPVYQITVNDKSGVAPLHDHTLNECPASFITAESKMYVETYLKAERLKIQAGEMCFGPDPSEWPARFASAMFTIAEEKLIAGQKITAEQNRMIMRQTNAK